MSWANYGYGSDKWNIDHIYPLSKLDLSNSADSKKGSHYTNLRPMWQVDNFKKRNNIISE